MSRALTTKPARSCDRITRLPSTSVANRSLRSIVGSPVGSDGTSSTSASTGTGLKKCMPITASGRRVAMASFMMGIDDVFDARMASADSTARSTRSNTATLAASSSTTASITSSRSASWPGSVAYAMRPSAASMSAASSLPRSTPVDSDDSMRPRPALLAASSASTTTTSSPARAATSAMPEPMRPQPTTPIRVGVDGDAADSLMAANVAGDSGRWLSAGGASSPWRPDPCQLQRFEHTLKASAQSRSPLTGGETMDHAPIDQVADLRSPPPVGAPPELAIDDLARLFGIADLADRLTAVDQRIADALGRDGTVLAPAAARVASTGGERLRPLLTIVAAALGDVFD